MTRVVGTLSFSYGFHPIYFYTRLIVPRLVAPSSLKQSISRKPPVQCQSNSGIQRHDSSARASLSSRLMIGAARRTARGGYRKVFTDFPKPHGARSGCGDGGGRAEGGPPTEQQNMFRLLRCRKIVSVAIPLQKRMEEGTKLTLSLQNWRCPCCTLVSILIVSFPSCEAIELFSVSKKQMH